MHECASSPPTIFDCFGPTSNTDAWSKFLTQLNCSPLWENPNFVCHIHLKAAEILHYGFSVVGIIQAIAITKVLFILITIIKLWTDLKLEKLENCCDGREEVMVLCDAKWNGVKDCWHERRFGWVANMRTQIAQPCRSTYKLNIFVC